MSCMSSFGRRPGKKIERQGDHVHVARTLSVAEQSSFTRSAPASWPVCGCHRGAAVVVRVNAHTTESRLRTVVEKYSITSAYVFGPYISTVLGRLR